MALPDFDDGPVKVRMIEVPEFHLLVDRGQGNLLGRSRFQLDFARAGFARARGNDQGKPGICFLDPVLKAKVGRVLTSVAHDGVNRQWSAPCLEIGTASIQRRSI